LGKRYHPHPKTQALALVEQTASLKPEISPDATMNPGLAFESTSERWMGKESTSVPEIGEPDCNSSYAEGSAELFDKFLQGRMPLVPRAVFLIITLAWFIFISFLFMKDNELGRLDTLEGLKWFATKMGAYSILYLLIGIVIFLTSKSFNPRKKNLKNK